MIGFYRVLQSQPKPDCQQGKNRYCIHPPILRFFLKKVLNTESAGAARNEREARTSGPPQPSNF